VQSSGSPKALRIFYLQTRSAQIGWTGLTITLVVALAATLVPVGTWSADSKGEEMAAKRRQQGILTGMPFMANVAPRTFVDDLGRKIFLAKAPTRIVSLAPSITETLYAIGSGDQIVGVTEFCNFPAEAQSKPKVGYSHANIESIVALQPDLVLAPREFLRADVLGKLEQLKIATFIVEARTVEDIPAKIQTVGRMLDRSQSADQLAMDVRQQLKAIRARTEKLAPRRVLYVLNSLPLITVGPGSFIHQLIELAGGENVAAGAPTSYPRLSIEEVIKKDPEIIIFPVGSVEGIPTDQQELWRRWSTISAVKHGRFHQIPSDLLNRPGPRISEGLELLTKIIHPDALSSGPAAEARR
jgi:ABC-type Fe3+-hydroxamate transport system substrate-binding protein